MYIYIVLSYYHKLMVSKVLSNPFNFTFSVFSLKRNRCEYFFSKCFFNKHGHPDQDISGVKQSALCLFPLWTQSQTVSSGKSGVMILIPHRHNKGNPTPPPAYMEERHETNVAMWIHVSQFIQLWCMAKAVRPFMRPAEGFLCCISLTKIITLRKYKENQVYSSTVGHPLLSYPV